MKDLAPPEGTEPSAHPAGPRTIETGSGFADLARRYHPDKAQDDGKAMSVVNDANERLLALLANA
jgi:hypothetical protein